MIIQAFLRWIETARASDRAKAAGALARAYLRPDVDAEQRHAALLAMCYLLDDPSPQVRLELAEALAHAPNAPRAPVLALAEDQPEISGIVLMKSSVLEESDLIDLAATGTSLTCGFIAARADLSPAVCAALVEVGDEATALVLLENAGINISGRTLNRLTERFGDCVEVRRLLLERHDLPADARQTLVLLVTDALAGSALVSGALAPSRLERVAQEACETATVMIAGDAGAGELSVLVEHLRTRGQLTPALLIQTLCTGQVAFFAVAMAVLSGLEERRVRSLLATGRMHAVRALFESAGLARNIASIFVEATLLWRRGGDLLSTDRLCGQLLDVCAREEGTEPPVAHLLDLVEKLQHQHLRAVARSYAHDVLLAA